MAIAMVGQEIGGWTAIVLSSTYTSLFASFCMYIGGLLEDVSKTLADADSLIKEDFTKYRKQTEQLKASLIEAIELHTWTIK